MGGRVLIVEDDRSLCDVLAQVAARWGDEVLQAHGVGQATPLLASNPGLLIFDVCLPDGTGIELVKAASRRHPVPTMVAMSGRAAPEEAFRLAQAGVRSYLAKPLDLEDLVSAVDAALCAAPDLEPLAVGAVGHRPLRGVQEEVRRAMFRQALARAEGNRSEAARLLRVSRQAVQQMIGQREGDR